MAKQLEGKVALVTGGSRGIGRAVVKRLAAAGATVAFTYQSSTQKAEALVRDIEEAGGNAYAIQADSGDLEQAQGSVRTTVQELGGIDILVNNAGIGTMGPIGEISFEAYQQLFAVNVGGVFATAQEASRHMKEGGRIINIGSVLGDKSHFPGTSVYSATKAAVAGFTRGLARELGARGITVNVVQPGPIETDMNPDEGEFAALLKGTLALPRYGTVDEIAGLVTFLAGPESSYITGQSLTVDGGFLA